MTVINRRGWIMIMIGALKMNKADINYIIEKLDSYKPDNIYDGFNSVREKQIHLKEKINQLQTYKLFQNDKETYLSKQDVIELISEIEREGNNE